MDSRYGGYYPDYELIDRLQKASNQEQDEYLLSCPHWEAMCELRVRYQAEGWWDTTRETELERIKLDPARGLVVLLDGSSYTCDEVWGDISRPD